MTKQLLLLFLVIISASFVGHSQEDSLTQDIEEVTISARKKKKIIFKDPKYYIVDFTISDTNAFMLMKNLGKYYIYELDENMQFINKLRVKMNANSLFQDCFGNTHLVTKDSVYFILNDTYGLFLTETRPRKKFMRAMEQCVGNTSDKIILEKKTYFDEFQTFYARDIDSGYHDVIYEINDSTLVSRAQSETNQPQDGISEVRVKKRYRIKYFVKPHKYNPLFVVDDTLYIFNHFEGRMDQLEDEGEIINSLTINHHKKRGWNRLVYSDLTRKQFYAVWVKNGAQHLIGLAMNEEEQNFGSKITKHAYPEKVVIRNGYAYYTYKPNVDANLNVLYRQKL